MEIVINLPKKRPAVKAVLFDFDGTLSTLRHGWEEVMEPLMLEMIAGPSVSSGEQPDDALVKEVREYIDRSAGIQTYCQMKWLTEAVKSHGRNPGAPGDPWWYKAEYNRRLMETVEKRITEVLAGGRPDTDYLVKGSKELLKMLADKGVAVYAASGTDDPDVKREAEVLGLGKYFKEIAGAPPGRADCSKEAVLKRLTGENGLHGLEVAVIGDGKVEISLGREVGAVTLGVASDETGLGGVNPVKRERLVRAGAHAITGDFTGLDEIMNWLAIY